MVYTDEQVNKIISENYKDIAKFSQEALYWKNQKSNSTKLTDVSNTLFNQNVFEQKIAKLYREIRILKESLEIIEQKIKDKII
jgi:hypothetical protein